MSLVIHVLQKEKFVLICWYSGMAQVINLSIKQIKLGCLWHGDLKGYTNVPPQTGTEDKNLHSTLLTTTWLYLFWRKLTIQLNRMSSSVHFILPILSNSRAFTKLTHTGSRFGGESGGSAWDTMTILISPPTDKHPTCQKEKCMLSPWLGANPQRA